MFNKSKLKKFIADGKKYVLAFDKKEGWIVDGYSMYTTKSPVMEKVLTDAFYKTESVYIRAGVEESTAFPFSKIIEKDYRDAKPLELTPYIYQTDKFNSRIFLNENGIEVPCQQKYLDILDDFTNYRYTQHSSVAPVYIWYGDELLGLILPLRIGEPSGYQVVRS